MSKKKKALDFTAYEDRAALCPHFEKCGGCTLQKVSYEKQLKIKADEVMGLISDAYDPETFDFEGILNSPLEEGYRNKMEFTFGDSFKDGPLALGLHQRGSFMNIVNITDCHLVHDDLNKVRNKTYEFFNEYYEKGLIRFHNNKTHKGYLRHLLLRRAQKTGEILVALVTTSKISEEDTAIDEKRIIEDYKNAVLSLDVEGMITGVIHIINDGLADTVRADRIDILYGRDYLYDEVLGLRFKISVFSFFQTNTLGAEVLYNKAREYAGLSENNKTGTLFDLYCGTGTISQLMSSAAEEVVGVEIVAEAVEAAKENAALNGITNTRFIAEDVLKAVDVLGVPDALILDPPREGIHPKALGKILSWGVDQVVYVSCKPSSLARDLRSFRFADYKLKKVCCVDMFPETVHVETVALLCH